MPSVSLTIPTSLHTTNLTPKSIPRFNKVGVGSVLVCKAHCFGEAIQATLGIEIKYYIGIILQKN